MKEVRRALFKSARFHKDFMSCYNWLDLCQEIHPEEIDEIDVKELEHIIAYHWKL
jgi:hypothetical protein